MKMVLAVAALASLVACGESSGGTDGGVDAGLDAIVDSPATEAAADASADAGLTYESVTTWVTPPFTATRVVTFTDEATLAAAIAGMQPGDSIQYAGTSVLTIGTTSSAYDSFSNLNPSSAVELHLGAGNGTAHVKFEYTGTAAFPAVFLHDSSNLRIYGGEMTTPNGGAGGILVQGNTHDVTWWDFVIHDVGGTGLSMFPTMPNGSDVSTIQRCSFRGEVSRWGQNLAWDPHAEKGTGLHGANLADVHNTTTNNSGVFVDNTVALYTHDGASGAGIEIGESAGTGSQPGDLHGNTIYCKAVNLTKAATQQVAGNTFNLWGDVPYTNLVIGWAEGENLQGRVVDGQGISSKSVSSGQVTVQHGRHQTTNQNPALSSTEPNESPTQPYDDRWGIDYQDTQ